MYLLYELPQQIKQTVEERAAECINNKNVENLFGQVHNIIDYIIYTI